MQHAFVLTYFNLLRATFLPSKNKNIKITNSILTKSEQNNFYWETIKTTVKLGADTDTNCYIVGSMIGALLGMSCIPKFKLNKLLSLNYAKSPMPRPKFLSIQENCLSNIQTLINIRPLPTQKLIIKKDSEEANWENGSENN